jgi:3-(3-hydroxy-phenyl)propionate hydroxylase
MSGGSRAADIADVAIVGAGPVGVIAAHFCGVYGLSAVAVDREADVYDLPRAAALHDDAQRILHNAGVLDAVLPETCVLAGAEFVDAAGKRINGLEVPPGLVTPNGYTPVLNIDQPGLEAAMRSRLLEREGIELRLSHEVLEIVQHEDHVELRVRDTARDRTRLVRARWAIGCDGASSFVRKSCAIAWHSLGYDCEWLVVDLELTRDADLPTLCQQICDPERPTTFVPMPGRLSRWEFRLGPGETRAEMEDRARVWELLRPWLSRDDGRIVRAVVYRFHATIADTFRSGRVFLAGDAAHQTPPFMGQGLCTGIRDVENLVWKLAMVRDGRAGDALLDTYTEERRPLAVAMVEHSTNTGKLIDAYAEMARGGPEPPAELQEYAYGGGRVLPHLSTGLLAHERSEWVGQLVPSTTVEADGESGSFDDVVGPRWAVLSKDDVRAGTRRLWEDIGAVFVRAPEPDSMVHGLLHAHDAIVVRPDRIVYAGVSADGLDALAERLAAELHGARPLSAAAG